MEQFTVTVDNKSIPINNLIADEKGKVKEKNASDYTKQIGIDHDENNPIKFPDNIKIIGRSTFINQLSLRYITLPEGLITIEPNAFYNCANLININFPNSLESIGDNAFYNCANLININFPNSLKSIGWNAFRKCTSLININFPHSLKSIGDYALVNVPVLPMSHSKKIQTQKLWILPSKIVPVLPVLNSLRI